MQNKLRILVLINSPGEGVLSERAKGLFSSFNEKACVTFVYRKRNRLMALLIYLTQIITVNPDLIYIIDTTVPAAYAGIIARLLLRKKIIVDTGDLGYELAVSKGRSGKLGRGLIYLAETLSIRLSTIVIVRGSYHKTYLEGQGITQVEVIRDATWVAKYQAQREIRLGRVGSDKEEFLLGLVGTISYNPNYGICYGWDLIECLSLLKDNIPCKAIIIGDGTGLSFLKSRAREIGVADKVKFLGRVPYESLQDYLSLFDIAISTQTNNNIGMVRTTSKLVEYLAAGCFVIASDVGEASIMLPEIMKLPYEGMKDINYPAKLAARIQFLYENQNELQRAALTTMDFAAASFDYSLASERLFGIIKRIFACFDLVI